MKRNRDKNSKSEEAALIKHIKHSLAIKAWKIREANEKQLGLTDSRLNDNLTTAKWREVNETDYVKQFGVSISIYWHIMLSWSIKGKNMTDEKLCREEDVFRSSALKLAFIRHFTSVIWCINKCVTKTKILFHSEMNMHFRILSYKFASSGKVVLSTVLFWKLYRLQIPFGI